MNQNDVKRQAIKEKAKAEQLAKKKAETEVLSGVIDNESKTYTFEKTVTMNGGQKKTGVFKAKYLSITGRLRIGTLRAKMLDGAPEQSVDRLTDDIAYMIAYLSVALIETPKWWSYDALDEFSELREMYLEVFEFNNSFRRKNESVADAGSSEAADGEEVVEDK